MPTLQERFLATAKLLGGGGDRWQAAAGARLGISRGHMHHLVTGARTVTQQMIVKSVEVAREEAKLLRERADALDAQFEDVTLKELATAPVRISKDDYERQSDEAEQMIREMTGHAGEQENDDE